jgi:hypothetical protein
MIDFSVMSHDERQDVLLESAIRQLIELNRALRDCGLGDVADKVGSATYPLYDLKSLRRKVHEK